jgi:WD40 repeat protein
MTGSAIGRVLVDGRDAGSGFAVADGCALTAGHVVRSATEKTLDGQQVPVVEPGEPAVVCVLDGGKPALARVVVQYQPEGAEPIPVTRIEVSTSLDVAVLRLRQSAPAVLPAGTVTTGAEWRVDSRPRASDPALTGTVTDPARRLRNQRGEETTLVQLWVREELGDYQGYSGSPVTLPPTGGMPARVLGVLVEQGRWRVSAGPGQPAPVANVLFAAPIDLVLAEFGLTGVTVGEPAGAIPLPVAFEVRRLDELNQVMDALIEAPSDGQLVGLAGMGGSGKSVLAAAAARDPTMREAFPDGQFWLELGQDPPLLQLQASLAAVLGDSRPITDVPQGRARLSRLLAERRCLLVLDNVWARGDLVALAVVGSVGRVLVTTRDAATLPGATVISLGELNPGAAMLVLAGWAGLDARQLPEEAEQIARECGYLPLALAVCGALINAGSHNWPQVLDLLRKADLDALRVDLEDYPHPSLAVALGASINTLAADTRDRYQQLAVFAGHGPVPAATLQVLWGLDQQHTSALVDDLAAKSLLRAEAGRVSLHDLQMDYLVRSAAADLPALHHQLLAAYRAQCHGGWASGPDDGYFYQHLAHHLRTAGRIPEVRALLLDLDWMQAQLAIGNLPGLLADFDTVPSDPALVLVAGALRMSAHVLADDPGQLPGQLTGRLTSQRDPQLRDLLQRARGWSATPWLRPLTASLLPPGGPLLRTLAGLHGGGRAVAVSAGGGRAVTASGDDQVARVWDLDSGELLRTLAGHDGGVRAVAVSGDGGRAVTASGDDQVARVVRVWDLDSGELLRTLVGADGGVLAVAVSGDGRRAVTASGEYQPARRVARVWDLDSGELLHTLTGHHSGVRAGGVRAVAVSGDGRRVVTGATALEVWDLDSGELLRSVPSHYGWVVTVAVSRDGRRAVTGSEEVFGGYQTVRVWDLDTASPTLDPDGDGGWTLAVAVSADGRRAVTGSFDGVARVWDLDSGELRHTLTGHRGEVEAVAVSADGRRAVTGSGDGVARVWDLDSGELRHTLTGHRSTVWAVAVSADGRRAVTGGGEDPQARVWDLDSGKLLWTLPGHRRCVQAVAVSADGRRAVTRDCYQQTRVWDLKSGKQVVSPGQRLRRWFDKPAENHLPLSVSADGRRAVAGRDQVGQVWDLGSGHLLHTLTGHDGDVGAAAVSADGRLAVTGSNDQTVRVWDLDSGELLRTLTSHDGKVRKVVVSADGRRAVTASDDQTVRMWDLTQGMVLASFTSDSHITDLAATPLLTRVVAGVSDGTMHLLEPCGCE